MSERLSWEELTVQDAFDIASCIAVNKIDDTTEHGPRPSTGTLSFAFKDTMTQQVHTLGITGTEKWEALLYPERTVYKLVGHSGIVQVEFAYDDSSGGESVVLKPNAILQKSEPVDVTNYKLSEYVPWAKPCILPLVELHYSGGLIDSVVHQNIKV